MTACPVAGLGARAADAAMMNRVAFPLPQGAVRQLDQLAAWAREQQHVGDALGRQGRGRTERDGEA
eukprot:6259344-Alexandrium_andersonii.AAC.1